MKTTSSPFSSRSIPFSPSLLPFLSRTRIEASPSPPLFTVLLEISLAGISKNAGRKDVDVGVVEDDVGNGGLFYADTVCWVTCVYVCGGCVGVYVYVCEINTYSSCLSRSRPVCPPSCRSSRERDRVRGGEKERERENPSRPKPDQSPDPGSSDPPSTTLSPLLSPLLAAAAATLCTLSLPLSRRCLLLRLVSRLPCTPFRSLVALLAARPSLP